MKWLGAKLNGVDYSIYIVTSGENLKKNKKKLNHECLLISRTTAPVYSVFPSFQFHHALSWCVLHAVERVPFSQS